MPQNKLYPVGNYEVGIYCNVCGTWLEIMQTCQEDYCLRHLFKVEPCPVCAKREAEAVADHWYNVGLDEGFDDGRNFDSDAIWPRELDGVLRYTIPSASWATFPTVIGAGDHLKKIIGSPGSDKVIIEGGRT